MAVAELADLSEAMDIAVKVDFDACTPRDRRHAVSAIARLESQLMALRATVAEAYERHNDWAGYGHPSAAAGVRETARVPMHSARSAIALGRASRRMPVTHAALADGSLTPAHALRLRPTSKRASFAGEGETLLVEQAQTLRWAEWLEVVEYWEQLADDAEHEPDGGDPRDERATLHVSQLLDGMGKVDGVLDPVGFAAVEEALHRIERELFEQDWRETRERLGGDATPDQMPRTPAQRRAAALVEMAYRATTAPKDGKRPLPLVVIHTDPDTFNTELARVLDVEPPALLGTARKSELDSGTVVPPTVMMRAALHGTVRRLVYSSPSHVLDYGREVRLFQGQLRQAIIHAARRCAVPGCDVRASRCEIDHVEPERAGGPTAAHNGQPLCRSDHRHKSRHEPG